MKQHTFGRSVRAVGVGLLVTVAAVLPSSPAAAASTANHLDPSTTIFSAPANPAGGCTWWLRYFNYGSVPVAQLRLNGGSCGSYDVRVVGQAGSTTAYSAWSSTYTSSGNDACGGYYEKGVQLSGSYYAIGADVRDQYGNVYKFRYDGIWPISTAAC